MESLRARILAAIGVSSLAGCPPAREPMKSTVVAEDAAVATVVVPDVAPEVAAETSPEVIDATPIETSVAKQPPPPGIAPLPPDAWYVSYPLAKPPASYCPNGSAVCVSLDWATKQQGKPGQATCPPQIVEACRCPPGVGGCAAEMFQQPCPDTFHTVVTANERKAGKKNACCYAQEVHCTPPWVGRALRDEDDRVVRAASTRRSDWQAENIACDPANAAHYAEVAAGEHASVASFAHVALELMAFGAPADLLADTFRAALDEIEHARFAYARAGVGPGPLRTTRALAPSLTEFALSTLRDACVPETVGAVLAAEVPGMQPIAEDEARHAELAFRTLAWAIRAGGDEVREAIRHAKLQAPAVSGGLLDETRERALITSAMENIVEPCVAAVTAPFVDRAPDRGTTPRPRSAPSA